MEESGMAIAAISNSGNIVIDSLIGYWYVTAKKKEIDFQNGYLHSYDATV